MNFSSYRLRGGSLDDRQTHCSARMPRAGARVVCHAMSDTAISYYAYQEPPVLRGDRWVNAPASFTPFHVATYARLAA